LSNVATQWRVYVLPLTPGRTTLTVVSCVPLSVAVIGSESSEAVAMTAMDTMLAADSSSEMPMATGVLVPTGICAGPRNVT